MADETADGCLKSSRRRKTAGATLYLMEELGDARLRCDQLLRYIDEAVKLIEKSSHKDHFFEVAGHLIHNVPDVAFKLQKALQAVALAADRIDYEELKQELRPEKVDELEKVLKEVRIRPVQRRSFPPMPGVPGVPMKPKQAADRLRQIAKTAREEGSLPLRDMATLVRELDPGRKASGPDAAAATLEKLAEAVENSQGQVSPVQLATLLSRMAMEAEFNRVLKFASKPKLTQETLQLGSAEEVKKKFKQQNPNISDAELDEIAKQWQANKDVVKDKAAAGEDPQLEDTFLLIKELGIDAARAAGTGRWRMALTDLFEIVDGIGTVLVHLGSLDTQKSEALKRQIHALLPQANSLAEGIVTAGDDDKRSRYEEGKPADPTKNMDADDAQKWKDNTEEHKDKFKAAGKKIPAPGGNVIEEIMSWHGGQGTNLYAVGSNWYAGRPVDSEDAADAYDELKRHKANRAVLRDFKEHLQEQGVKVASDDDKRSKFEEGKPADPTKNMDADDAKEWKDNTEEHKDKFKAASDLAWKAAS